jgi:hypothetical protein
VEEKKQVRQLPFWQENDYLEGLGIRKLAGDLR